MEEAPESLPSSASSVAQVYPDVWKAFAALRQTCSEARPRAGMGSPIVSERD
ncbi:hypothetical protein [Microvirga arabica]|uniref:hypothetical protein n=1 Tax=Microvirga arabica TaxID=1128671 RepID=UPI00193A5881|nr:hypothetical protein [Microvirga arabica]MBM1172433.1 hypothetical protein [Microvirga arabica]